VLCLLLALAGAFCVSLAPLGTPLGAAIFGALAAALFAAAVGLWQRRRGALIAVTLTLTLLSVFLVVCWALDPTNPANVLSIIPLGLSVALIAYLWSRRRRFGARGEAGAGLLSFSGVAAATVVLLAGGGWVVLVTMDDAPRSFPDLHLEQVAVPDGENAFLALRDIIEGGQGWEQEVPRFLSGGGDGPPVDEQWAEEAAAAVDSWGDWQERLDEMLGRRQFAPPEPQGYLEFSQGPGSWLAGARELARRIRLLSRLHALEGRPSEAMAAARKCVAFGLMLCDQNDGLATYLVGNAILALGLEQVREVASDDSATVELLRPAADALDMSGPLQRGFERALAHELRNTELFLRTLKDLQWIEEALAQGRAESYRPYVRWVRTLIRDPVPFAKSAMTRNLAGARLMHLLQRARHYEPAQPAEKPGGLLDIVGEVGLLHFVRNPAGDAVVLRLPPVPPEAVEVHLRRLADVRLTQMFLALRCYHLEQGRLPAGLVQLTPRYLRDVPTDPFTRRAFRYEPDGNVPRIYSVGPDREPDGGTEATEDDLVAELAFAAAGRPRISERDEGERG
jgi:hypothetical protein